MRRQRAVAGLRVLPFPVTNRRRRPSSTPDSLPIRQLRALEQVSPAHAETLGALAVDILRDLREAEGA